MGQLEDLRAFVQIVEHESIGKAAEAVGIAKSAMSRRLSLLENRMQARLITRTPQKWVLTEAGRQYYERGVSLLNYFDAFEGDIRNETRSLSGTIRVSAPLYFGKHSLTDPLLAFAETHPGIRLHLDFSDRLVDVVAENFDLVIRITEMEDSTLIARKLCDMRHVVCASPEYLKTSPGIVHPKDLNQHPIIQFGSASRLRWTFPMNSGKDISVSLNTVLSTQDGSVLLAAAERGLGVARMPEFVAGKSIEKGRLREVLGDYPSRPLGIYAVYPANKYLPTRTRALIDFLVEHLNGC